MDANHNLLLVTHNFSLSHTKWMGPNFFMSLFSSPQLQQHNVEIHVVSRAGKNLEQEKGPIYLHQVKSPSIFTEPFDNYGQIWTGQLRISPIQDIWSRFQDSTRVGWRTLGLLPKVSLAHWTEPYLPPIGNMIRLYSKLKGIRNLLTLFNYQRSYPAHDLLLRTSLGGFEQVLTTTNALAEHLTNIGVAANRLRCIPLGVPLERFSPPTPEEKIRLRKNYNIPRKATIVLWFGPIIPPSRLEDVHLLLDSVPTVKRHSVDTHFIFAFKYGIPPGLSNHTEDCIHLLDKYPDIRDLMRLADIVAVPFTADGLWFTVPLSFIEAQACGVPVVTIDHPGLREAISNGESGILVKNAEDFPKVLAELCVDKDRLTHLSRGARKWAEDQFDIQETVKQYYHTWFDKT